MAKEKKKYDINTQSKSWFVVIQVANMKKAGLSDEQILNPEVAANYMLTKWITSGKNRIGAIAVCESASGLYHMHAALYCEGTTLNSVSKTMFDSHVEPAGPKNYLLKYILKEDEFREKGEKVIYQTDINIIRSNQGKRSDLKEIEYLLNKGLTPEEIMTEQFSYRRYEKMINSAFIAKKKREIEIRKNLYLEWHVGESGTGKTFTYEKLLQIHGREGVFFTGSPRTGWLDNYMKAGAPDVLFIDDLKPQGDFAEMLSVMDIYSSKPIHARYEDIYPLWTTLVITSVYPPELWYSEIVKDKVKQTDSFEQVLRRISVIVFHYIENGEYKEYRIPASQYKNYEELKARAMTQGGTHE